MTFLSETLSKASFSSSQKMPFAFEGQFSQEFTLLSFTLAPELPDMSYPNSVLVEKN